MSDSLRDQLLKAGFNQSKTEKSGKKQRKHKPKPKSAQPQQSMSIDEAQAAARLANKSVNKAAARQRYRSVSPAASSPGKNKTRKAPVVKPRAGGWGAHSTDSTAENNPQNRPPATSVQRLEGETEIRALILAEALKNFTGNEVYRFTVQNKIREILVSESIRQQLVDGKLAITQLDDATKIIGADAGRKIESINPQWIMVIAPQEGQQDSAGYDDYPVPDDLTW